MSFQSKLIIPSHQTFQTISNQEKCTWKKVCQTRVGNIYLKKISMCNAYILHSKRKNKCKQEHLQKVIFKCTSWMWCGRKGKKRSLTMHKVKTVGIMWFDEPFIAASLMAVRVLSNTHNFIQFTLTLLSLHRFLLLFAVCLNLTVHNGSILLALYFWD